MEPKREFRPVPSVKQSDMHWSWVYGQDYHALLRSTGHKFRDGRWTSDDDGSFLQYSVSEPPAVSELFPFTFPSYEEKGEGDFPGTPMDGSFRVCITRGYDSSVYYGSIADVPIPKPVDPEYGDLVLSLNAQGTAFIKRARPGNPTAGLFQFVGELHDIPRLPRLKYSGLKTFRDLGENYLNVVFGWQPFVKDLVDMYNTQQRLESSLKKLRDNNGLIVRRRESKKTSTAIVDAFEGSLSSPFGRLDDTTIGGDSRLKGFIVGGPLGCANADLYPLDFTGQCDYNCTVMDTTTTWNCGSFGYYVPDIGSSQWTERAKRALFGQNPTPSQLWELLPWSWLIDWFSNVGDIMSNISTNAVDNETWTNCFSMREIDLTTEIIISNHWDEKTGSYGFHLPAGSSSLKYSRSEIQKWRRQASPYGFGLSWPDFSLRQLGILAALGITRR